MNKEKVIVDQSLNDSDDSSFIFQNPTTKRKPTVKLLSPSRKKLKVNTTKSLPSRTSKRESIRKFVKSSSGNSLELSAKKPNTSMEKHEDVFNKTIASFKKHNSSITLVSSSELEKVQNAKSPMKNEPLIVQPTQDIFQPLCNSKIINDSLICPLCSKGFDSKSCHLSHMKQCAKKKKLSTAQLLLAIEKQKSGSSGSIKDHCQPSEITKKKQVPVSSTVDADLAMAVALSISESAAGKTISDVDRTVIEHQKVTLEKFGFTTTGRSASSVTRRGKASALKNTVLKTRSAEDRLKLLTEKAAVILLCEEISCPSQPCTQRFQGEPLQFQTSLPKLWELGECGNDGPWYLENLKEVLVPEGAQRSSRTSVDSVSTVDFDQYDSNSINEDLIHSIEKETENDTVAILINEDEELNTYRAVSQRISLRSCSDDDLSILIDRQKLPTCTLASDWNKLVNNKEYSDISVNACDGQFFLHSLVLRTRCPGFFLVDYESIINEITSSAVLVFLRYVYSGELSRITRSDLQYLTKLSKSFGLSSLSEIVADLSKSISQNSVSNDFIMSSVSPAEKSMVVCQDAVSMTDVSQKPEKSEASPRAADEADTAPSSEPDVEEIPIVSPNNSKEPSEIVDLTQNPDDENDMEAMDRSYWSLLRHQREREMEIERQREEELNESIEREREMEKIQSFHRQNESNKCLIENMEKEELEESQKEREKIFQLSRNSEKDLFEDLEDGFLPPNAEEVIIVSSDEEKNDFDVSTDDDNTEAIPKAENLTFEAPFIPPPDDFFSLEGVVAMSPLPSQSLITAAISPKTPRKVLGPHGILKRSNFSVGRKQSNITDASNSETPIKELKLPISSLASSTPLKQEFNATEGSCTEPISILPNTTEPCPILSEKSIINDSLPTMVGPTHEPIEIKIPRKHRRRPSTTQILGSKIVKKSKKSLNNLRKSVGRRSFRNQRVLPEEEALSSSLVQGLSEPWCESSPKTPKRSQPFIEITPKNTPSMQIEDKVTPRPDFTGMKTGSIKKHLQKYGLKRGLSKTKAKKILCHIYDELHPVVNTKTGKFVKFLPEEASKKKRNKKRTTSNKRSTIGADKGVSMTEKALQTANTGRAELFCEDQHSSISSEFDTQSESDGGEEFGDLEDEILTQQKTTSISVEEAVTKFITDNADFRRRVLLYDPIWVEELRRSLQSVFGVKFKLIDIMDFLDKKCITFRSEARAANNKRRNEKKRSRQSPKKRKKVSESKI